MTARSRRRLTSFSHNMYIFSLGPITTPSTMSQQQPLSPVSPIPPVIYFQHWLTYNMQCIGDRQLNLSACPVGSRSGRLFASSPVRPPPGVCCHFFLAQIQKQWNNLIFCVICTPIKSLLEWVIEFAVTENFRRAGRARKKKREIIVGQRAQLFNFPFGRALIPLGKFNKR